MNLSNLASSATIIAWLERNRRPVGLAMLAAIGLALGAWISNIAAQHLWANMPPAPPPLVKVKEEPVYIPPPFEKFSSILELNLMQVMVERPVAPDPTTSAAAAATAPVEPVIDVSPLPAEVIGTLGGNEAVAVALIRDKRNKEVDLYWVGDRLFDQATIVEISRGEVKILRNGKTEVLQLYEQGDPGGGGLNLDAQAQAEAANNAAPAQPEKIDNGIVKSVDGAEEMPELSVRNVGDGEYVIDKATFEQAMNNLGPLLTQARVVPNFNKGKINGYKIFAIKTGSVFDQIGIKNGDIIHNVNGVSIDTPEKALQLFQQLRAETDFKIDVERGGAMKPLSYQLR